MSSAEDIVKDLSGMMQTAANVQVVTQMVQTYDLFASTAMQVMLTISDFNSKHEKFPEVIAQAAWGTADAMMAERKKRGLGGMP